MNKKVTCSVCPMACEIDVTSHGRELHISGNRCGRGYQFAQKYIDKDEKVVTGRCLLAGGQMSRLPVSTNAKIPAELVREVLEAIQSTKVQAPIKRGQVIIENILGTGADVIAQRKAL